MFHKPQLCGPYGVRDYKSDEHREHRYIGEGAMSAEGSSQARYLWHAPDSVPFPRSRSHKVGEIGWGIPTFVDWTIPNSGQQIQLGEFRQLVEDRYTHLYQNAWYPGPGEEITPDSDAALVMNVYKNTTSRSKSDKQHRGSEGRRHSKSESIYSSSSGSSLSSSSSSNSNNNNNNNNINNRYGYSSSYDIMY